MNAIRAYEVLYSQVLRLSKDYQSSSDTNYRTAIQALCSDGTVLSISGIPYYGEPIRGKMFTLLDMTGTVSGSLSMALLQSSDNKACPNTPWGIAQSQNLLDLCNIFGFIYAGPLITPNLISSWAPHTSLYYQTQNTGLGIFLSGSDSGSNITSPGFFRLTQEGTIIPYEVLYFGATLSYTSGLDNIIFGLADQTTIDPDNRLYFVLEYGGSLKIQAGASFATLDHGETSSRVYSGSYFSGDSFAITMDFQYGVTTCYQNGIALVTNTNLVTSGYVNAFFAPSTTLTDNAIFTNIQLSTTFPTL